MNNKKKEPWRIIVAIISIAYIIYMWVSKNVAEIYATLPAEQMVPLVVTNVVVTLAKVAGITLAILVIKWIASKFKR